jgi:hypothetical protein
MCTCIYICCICCIFCIWTLVHHLVSISIILSISIIGGIGSSSRVAGAARRAMNYHMRIYICMVAYLLNWSFILVFCFWLSHTALFMSVVVYNKQNSGSEAVHTSESLTPRELGRRPRGPGSRILLPPGGEAGLRRGYGGWLWARQCRSQGVPSEDPLGPIIAIDPLFRPTETARSGH